MRTDNLDGHNRLLLDNSSQDGSFLRWKLASELFLKAGLPAARVNFAQVKLNGRDLTLYVLIEPTAKVFLTRHFGSSAGNLYEGSNTDVEDKLDLDSGDPATAQRDLQSLASACREPNLPRRWDRLREILDVNRFAAFMALEVLICHHDGAGPEQFSHLPRPGNGSDGVHSARNGFDFRPAAPSPGRAVERKLSLMPSWRRRREGVCIASASLS
jgi:spore coat protein CotH